MLALQESETAQGLLASYISREELSSLCVCSLCEHSSSGSARSFCDSRPPSPFLIFLLLLSCLCVLRRGAGGAVPFGSVPKQASLGRNSNVTVLSVSREPQSRQGPERSRGRSGRGGIVWVYCLSKIEARDLLSGKHGQRVGASYKRTPLA